MGRKKKNQNNFVEGEVQQNEFDEAKLLKEYESILDIQRKQSDHLLGNFINGKYNIENEDIRQKLILIPKVFEKIEENVAYASIKLNQFVLNFKIEFLIEPTYCDAKLYIIEVEHDVEENIKHTTLLDSIVAPYSPTFREEVFKAWNVVYEGENYQVDDFLLRYLLMLDDEFMFNREIYAILGQLYVMRMLAFLTSLGEEGQKAEYEFKMLMEKILKENPDAANDFILQKRILDSIIKKNNLLNTILANENGRKIVEGYVKPIKNIEAKKNPSIIETVKPKKQEEKKEEKKEEEQEVKPAAKKKPAKKASKPAKKDDKKKDDKKKDNKKKDDKKKKGGGGTVKGGTPVRPASPKNGAAEKNFKGESGKSNQKTSDDDLFNNIDIGAVRRANGLGENGTTKTIDQHMRSGQEREIGDREASNPSGVSERSNNENTPPVAEQSYSTNSVVTSKGDINQEIVNERSVNDHTKSVEPKSWTATREIGGK